MKPVESLEEFGFSKKVVEALRRQGIASLNPVQTAALETRFLENNASLVVATPTGSGKTLIALLAAIKAAQSGKKTLFCCPLKAVASEHFDTFKKFDSIFKTALSIGDYDSTDPWLTRYDCIISTYEKADSLHRHKSKFIPDVGLLVIDEVHLLDSDRGPTLETLVTRFRQLFPKTQVLALSATIPNAKEIAKWLDAELVESDWRPTKLVKGVYHDGAIETDSGTRKVKAFADTPTEDIVADALSKEQSILVFVGTRPYAVAEARRLSAFTKKFATPELEKIADEVEHALETPTKQCVELAACVRNGAAFHTAGLVAKQRRAIEDAFREGKLRVIVATPTLAMGVNTPADTVVIRDVSRYTPAGPAFIPVREWHQMAGRAGRPGFRKEGLAVSIARDDGEKEMLWKKYVTAPPEAVDSQFGHEAVLRTQLLAGIAMSFTPTKEKISEFLLSTFYAFQNQDARTLQHKAFEIVKELERMGFVEEQGELLLPTPLGKRVSELYIDPMSADGLIRAMKSRMMGELGLLYMAVDTFEMRPYMRVKSREEAALWAEANEKENELGIDTVNIGFEDWSFPEKFKTTLVFNDWVNEHGEDELFNKWKLTPGAIHGMLQKAEWIFYSSSELAKLLHLNEKIPALNRMRLRVEKGVKAELLPLVELRGIGRVRARRLFRAGFRGLADVKKAGVEDLARVLGPAVAKSVKEQLKLDARPVAEQKALEEYE
jgi:helicase